MHTRLRQVREALRKENGRKLSQSDFAEATHVSRDTIANYELGRVEPTNIFIDYVCDKYNINEEWLRTGEGEMKKPLSSEAEKAVISAQVFKEDESSFRFQLMKAISAMPDEGLEMAYHFMEELVDNVRNKKGT